MIANLLLVLFNNDLQRGYHASTTKTVAQIVFTIIKYATHPIKANVKKVM
jgi:hypothetical protein